MKYAPGFVAFTAVLACGLFWQSRPSAESRADSATHYIAFSSKGSCSGTAVGRHALLTAAHCHPPDHQIGLDDFLNGVKSEGHTDNFMWVDGNKTQILDRINDGKDHVIYRTKVAFKTWASISGNYMHKGDQFFYFGNPGHAHEKVIYHDFLRRGYVAGIKNDADYGNLNFLDMDGYYGDSGAALFDHSGSIIGTINMIDYESLDDDAGDLKFMIAIDMNFRPDEIETAKKW